MWQLGCSPRGPAHRSCPSHPPQGRFPAGPSKLPTGRPHALPKCVLSWWPFPPGEVDRAFLWVEAGQTPHASLGPGHCRGMKPLSRDSPQGPLSAPGTVFCSPVSLRDGTHCSHQAGVGISMVENAHRGPCSVAGTRDLEETLSPEERRAREPIGPARAYPCTDGRCLWEPRDDSANLNMAQRVPDIHGHFSRTGRRPHRDPEIRGPRGRGAAVSRVERGRLPHSGIRLLSSGHTESLETVGSAVGWGDRPPAKQPALEVGLWPRPHLWASGTFTEVH